MKQYKSGENKSECHAVDSIFPSPEQTVKVSLDCVVCSQNM